MSVTTLTTGTTAVETSGSADLSFLARGLDFGTTNGLPPAAARRNARIPHATTRRPNLSVEDTRLALQNALRYFPTRLHSALAPEFLAELREYGHIYMYRFRPREEEFFGKDIRAKGMDEQEDDGSMMRAYPVHLYPAKSKYAASIMLMIMNNLDNRVAQFPHELITYGNNGSVFSNWAQFRLMMRYLSELENDETLHLYSGHPLGVFPSHEDAPRLIVSNGLFVPHYSSTQMYDRQYALGNSQYGNMTAGSYMYIGSAGIVAGTFTCMLGAARKYLKCAEPEKARETLRGKVFVTSGTGGMSGAQPKASVIAGCICVVAEVSRAAIQKRKDQGWLEEIIEADVHALVERIRKAKDEARPASIGFLGNIVDVWERLVEEFEKTGELLADLGSDQTSLHIPYTGGYYPVGMTVDEANRCMVEDPTLFKDRVHESLRRHAAAVNFLSDKGMAFWDYGNAFLINAWKAGAKVAKNALHTPQNTAEDSIEFRYPSYVQDIMGDVFSLGFGPFRWICTSCDPKDLRTTDDIATEVLKKLLRECDPSDRSYQVQLQDSLYWIEHADENRLVIGSQARILYANAPARIAIAVAINEAIQAGRITGTVVLSRDHHDVSGADSPWRETSNITDGSKFCSDMSFHTVIGNAIRGATWVAYHDGGGVGTSMSMNCGFGLVLDGSGDAAERAKRMLSFDVYNGVTRRAWSRNQNAQNTINSVIKDEGNGIRVTVSEPTDFQALDDAIRDAQL
eukprot:ANDGO_04792.mRNA.1 putative urocanate hydratase